jgi:hypothetical protein
MDVLPDFGVEQIVSRHTELTEIISRSEHATRDLPVTFAKPRRR